MNRSHLLPLLLILAALPLRAVEEPLPFPDMAVVVGQHLQKQYYDPGRFHPELMVRRALESLEGSETCLCATWEGDEIALSCAGTVVRVPAPRPKDLAQAMALIEAVRTVIDAEPRFDAQRRRQLAYVMLNGALATLDPHTVIFPPEPASDFEEDIKGEFFGVGAWLNQADGVIRIERVMPGLPADKAGVQDRDIILAIDGERTVGLALPQAVSRIKGPRGTQVRLQIERDEAGAAVQKEIAVVRDRITVPILVSWRRGPIGYVRLDEFNRNTAAELRTAIYRLHVEGEEPLRGLILDLRENKGGLLAQAQDTSDFFLPPSKEIVRTVALGEEPRIVLSSRDLVTKLPMAVLVGPGSASAAEILAGALQRNGRAVIVGETTFGKGSVQTVRKLPDGSQLKLTIQEYQLAGGVSIQERGVPPDLEFFHHARTAEGGVDLVPWPAHRERDNEYALHAHGAFAHQVALRLGWLEEYRTREQMRAHNLSSREFAPDQEAMLLVDLLAAALGGADADDVQEKAAQAFAEGRSAAYLIERLSRPVAERAEREAGRLAEALAGLPQPITWGPAAAGAPAAGSLKLTYTGPAEVTAGETVELAFTLANQGAAEVGRLYGVLDADPSSPLWQDEVVFGAVPAGGTVVGTLRFKVPPRALPGRERATVRLRRDAETDVLVDLPVEIAIRERPRPHFSYRWELVEAEAGRDGAIRPDEPVTVRIHLRNDGEADSAPAMVYVFKNDDPFTQLGEGRFKVGPVAAGAEAACEVPLTVRSQIKAGAGVKRLSAGEITLQIRAEERLGEDADGRFRADLFHSLKLPLEGPVTGGDLRQPRLAIERHDVGADHVLDLAVRIADDNPAFVSLFLGDDKRELRPWSQVEGGLFTARVPLNPGINLVRLAVTDADDITEALILRAWGAPVPPGTPARTPEILVEEDQGIP